MADKKQKKTESDATQPNQGFKFPTEIIDLPSGGRCYPKDHPLAEGKIEIKYMTAKEEDILTSQNLIKKGVVIDMLLNSLIATPGVDVNDLLLGDKNAVMMAARILAYGPDYKVEITDPTTMQKIEHTFDLSQLEFKELPDDVDYSESNHFEFKCPLSKNIITYKLLTGADEKKITADLKALTKLGSEREITTRLKASVVAVDGNEELSVINMFVDNMLARDARAFRSEIKKMQPDIDIKQEIITEGGDTVEVAIPMTVNFFWPSD
tara:strand:- start:1822 stop:2619 length:798 start_codon:yes stop_codon:yes gene_type:complete